ncbi:DUF397 domain-containing protein [Streptomyces sp. NPDC007875]|uniref:DUF397 domain-containing protein n=1 Tax=Streptomyces sp. NPDC007875 TaxID=3364783 RepID=UPI0036A970FD
MPRYRWRKSSYSGDASNCINVAADGNVIAVRESDEPAVVLATTPAVLRAFIRGAKDGAFDRIQEGRAQSATARREREGEQTARRVRDPRARR